MVILILLSIITTVFLERIWGFAQSSEGIEQSNIAYYDAVGLIEKKLIDPAVTRYKPWGITPATPTPSFGIANTGSRMDVNPLSNTIPAPGKWNSPYDSNYNIISLGDPIQIVIPNWFYFNNAGVAFNFRIPQITPTSGTGYATVQANSGIILWTFGYTWATLFASGETSLFRWQDLNTSLNMDTRFEGTTNAWTGVNMQGFQSNTDKLDNTNKCANYACTLKLSMIRPVQTSTMIPSGIANASTLPFLEYKITLPVPVPLQFMTLESSAHSYGFMRSKVVRIPQITTNTALDFAVLQ
jgi:hypothetical protein